MTVIQMDTSAPHTQKKEKKALVFSSKNV